MKKEYLRYDFHGIDERQLLTHPKVGASWEGFVIEQVLSAEPHDEAFFWATHQGAEIDLILKREGELYGVECKYWGCAPRDANFDPQCACRSGLGQGGRHLSWAVGVLSSLGSSSCGALNLARQE